MTRLAQLGDPFTLGMDPRFVLGNYWIEENPIDGITDTEINEPEIIGIEIVEEAVLVSVDYVEPAELIQVEAA